MRITPPNLGLWLTRYVRDVASTEGVSVTVSNKEPEHLELPLDDPLIIIRDDSGPRSEIITFDRSVGASVLAGSKRNDHPADQLALWLAGVLMDDAIIEAPGSPIASIEWDGCNGPYPVEETLDVARRYQTVQYTVVGTW